MRSYLAAVVLVASCDSSITLEVAGDRPIPRPLDAICVGIADTDEDGGHLGQLYLLVGELASLPQTLRVAPGCAASAFLWVRGDRRRHAGRDVTRADHRGRYAGRRPSDPTEPDETELIVFKRSTPAPVATPGLDRGDLDAIARRVKKNFKPEGGTKVLAAGKPPLTRDSIASFAEVLRLTFGVELSESEYDDTTAVFVAYYKGGDEQTRTMLATGWQLILAELRRASAPARQTAIAEVRAVIEQRFEAGAQAGIPWAATMNATIQKRTSRQAVPSFGSADSRCGAVRTRLHGLTRRPARSSSFLTSDEAGAPRTQWRPRERRRSS